MRPAFGSPGGSVLGPVIAAAVCLVVGQAQTGPEPAPRRLSTVASEFIFTQAPFAQCHASTLVELPNGDILAAWFGGTRESARDVAIWGARLTGAQWSAPEVLERERGVACWNPVLYRDSKNRIFLFYKYGTSPKTWRGAYRTSLDGRTWAPSVYLPEGMLGPIKNKPITLSDGDVLAGSSTETSSAWTCWAELSPDDGRTWTRHGPITVPHMPYGIIQPTLWESAPGHIKMLTRSTPEIGRICMASSSDGGRTWTPAEPTRLPNPNSGIDAVKMTGGHVALVYNHAKEGRSPLDLAISRDDGVTWSAPYVLEDEPGGEFSYPAVIQSRDGLLHITYTWKRQRIKHLVVDPKTLGE